MCVVLCGTGGGDREELIYGPHGEIHPTRHMETAVRATLYEEPRGSPCAGLEAFFGDKS